MNQPLADSYRACQAIVQASGSNFAMAFWLLPREKRQAMNALYAFARRTDDLGDNDASPVKERAAALHTWHQQLRAALAGEAVSSPILPAMADTVARFEIAPQLLCDIIAGVERDLTQTRYETWDDLASYCYQVAGAVGLACIPIWGTRGEVPREAAIACGEAFQLTNILRDLKEDAARDRIYLPQEDLARCRYTAAELYAGEANRAFDDLLEYELHRARERYDQAAVLHDYLSRDGQRVFRLMFGRYRAILAAIEREPRAVLARRISLSLPQKLWIAGRKLLASHP